MGGGKTAPRGRSIRSRAEYNPPTFPLPPFDMKSPSHNQTTASRLSPAQRGVFLGQRLDGLRNVKGGVLVRKRRLCSGRQSKVAQKGI